MRCLLILPLLCAAAVVSAADPVAYLEMLTDQPHVELVDSQPASRVRSHLIALGAMSKIRGVWSPRESERRSGTLRRFTWRIYDGVPSDAVLREVAEALPPGLAPTLLFRCEARACGSSAQWANRLFNQRVLYGLEKSQCYRVYSLRDGSTDYRLLLYASARTADRQYLHAELLEITAPRPAALAAQPSGM